MASSKRLGGKPDGDRIRLRIGLRATNKEDSPNNQSFMSARNAEGRIECERRISMRQYAGALAFLMILLVRAVIASCAKAYHEETERYVLVATNIELPYWQAAQVASL